MSQTGNNPTRFSFSNWYPIFEKRALKVKIRVPHEVNNQGKIVSLPWEFVDYLLEDDIILDTDDQSFLPYRYHGVVFLKALRNEETTIEEETWEPITQDKQVKRFPELSRLVQQVIDEYGHVFPKLDQCAPVDASWMNWNGKNKCTHPDQVFLLLKSSDIVSDFLDGIGDMPERRVDSTSPFNLVLKKFYSLPEGLEFRCIIKNAKLVGISQRYPNKMYPFLVEDRDRIVKLISSFFRHHVNGKFLENDYVMDIFISENDVVWIVDLNPLDDCHWGLFQEDDLEQLLKMEEPSYRVVDEESGLVVNEKFASRLPWDLKQLNSTGELSSLLGNLNFFKDFEEQLRDAGKI
eukprot:TRINITY_DN1150_c0_g2_i25.p1 TRINITY_DN1150_c0_g2~~TRINITY_DN1150_c0_g2_i25.p1  ORF type:complete len:388 (+),score=75.48 TRINITY_DN1150_c0_g2_i25:120-1166(+)